MGKIFRVTRYLGLQILIMVTKPLLFVCRQTVSVVRKRSVLKGFAVIVAVAATCYVFRECCSHKSGHKKPQGMTNLISRYLKMSAEKDKHKGCRMPALDPFAKEIMEFRQDPSPVVCKGKNWVECYKSECFVIKDILNEIDDVTCIYQDILFKNDYEIMKGEIVTKAPGEHYRLVKSNHVEVNCVGKKKNIWSRFENLLGFGTDIHWHGHATGFRPLPAQSARSARETVNVAIVLLDSMSRGGCIREMPKTYQYLGELGAFILNSYNIVGDGTAGAMFPILTGRNYLELNGTQGGPKLTIDPKDFIFHDFKLLGYRTAFLEDYPISGTFQMHYNGFKYQPVDDYLRTFTLEEYYQFCSGSIPKHKLLMNLADQFMQMTKRYFLLSMTILAHDNEELLSTMDDEFAAFLQDLKTNGRLNNTLLFVMGDHGLRFQGRRNSFQGRLEERLPLVAIVLPETVKKSRPDALDSLQCNIDVLTTPYDIHTTMLDAIGIAEKANDYKVPNSDFTRGLSLLKPIPRSRSCAQAGVSPHWCACAEWRPLSTGEPMYHRAAAHLASHINELTVNIRSLCVERSLTSVEWVQQLETSDQLLKNNDSHTLSYQVYQAKITMDPLSAKFEGTVAFDEEKQTFSIDTNHISRVNRYNDEPSCILRTHLDLHKFCLCRSVLLSRNRNSRMKTKTENYY